MSAIGYLQGHFRRLKPAPRRSEYEVRRQPHGMAWTKSKNYVFLHASEVSRNDIDNL